MKQNSKRILFYCVRGPPSTWSSEEAALMESSASCNYYCACVRVDETSDWEPNNKRCSIDRSNCSVLCVWIMIYWSVSFVYDDVPRIPIERWSSGGWILPGRIALPSPSSRYTYISPSAQVVNINSIINKQYYLLTAFASNIAKMTRGTATKKLKAILVGLLVRCECDHDQWIQNIPILQEQPLPFLTPETQKNRFEVRT